MANEVELRITGENDSKSATRDAADGIKAVGDEAEKAGPKVSGLGDKLDDAGKRSKKSSDDMAGGLDGVGESADGLETRFTGLASGIDGVTSLMDDPSPQEFAQGIADISDGIANSAVPALSRFKDGISGAISNFREGGISKMTSEMGGLGKAALGVGAALGVAGIAFSIKQIGDARRQADVNQIVEDFIKLGDASELLEHDLTGATLEGGKARDVFDELVKTAPELAEELIEQAEAADTDAETIAYMKDKLDEATSSTELAAASVERLSDAYQKMNDPIFAALDAVQGMRDAQLGVTEAHREVTRAQEDLNEAIEEHGRGSREAAEAQTALEEAQRAVGDAEIDAVAATADYEGALLNLQEAVERGDVSWSDFEATLGRWQAQGDITAQQAEEARRRVHGLSEEARDVPGKVGTTVTAQTGEARRLLEGMKARILDLDGDTATIYVNAVQNFRNSLLSAMFASGGVRGAAVGGPQNGATLVGENGPELVNLAPGSYVHPAANTGHMLGGSDGGLTVNINIAGSLVGERDVVQAVRDEFARGGFANLVGAR